MFKRPEAVDTSGLSFRRAPLSHDGAFASTQWAAVDWPHPLRHTSFGLRIAQGLLHDCEETRSSAGRDPPPYARSHVA